MPHLLTYYSLHISCSFRLYGATYQRTSEHACLIAWQGTVGQVGGGRLRVSRSRLDIVLAVFEPMAAIAIGQNRTLKVCW
jgi:hypothetical protein